MKVSRTISYAIYATLQLARESAGVPVSCSQLARVGQLPKRFLLQILRKLVKARTAAFDARSWTAGYYLSRSPEEITLRDIFETFEPTVEFKIFPCCPASHPAAPCACVVVTACDVSDAGRVELAKLSWLTCATGGGGSNPASELMLLAIH